MKFIAEVELDIEHEKKYLIVHIPERELENAKIFNNNKKIFLTSDGIKDDGKQIIIGGY